MELVDDEVAALPGAVDIADLRSDGWSERMARMRSGVILLTSKLLGLDKVHEMEILKHANIFKKLVFLVNTTGECIGAEREGALFCYYGVLRSVLVIIKAADECNAVYADTLAQLRLLFEVGRKVKAVLSSTGPSQEGLRVVVLKSAVETK